jgi:hypothetical protein
VKPFNDDDDDDDVVLVCGVVWCEDTRSAAKEE